MLDCCIIAMGGRRNARVRGSGSGSRSTFVLYNCDAQINQPPWICNNQPMHGSYLVSLKINKALLWFTIYIDE